AEPAERIDALIMPDRRLRDRLSADTVKSVAASNEIARNFAFDAIFAVTHARQIGGNVVQPDVLRLVDRRDAGCGACFHQVMGNFGLPIDGYNFAGQLMKIDALPLSVKVDLHAFMHQPLSVEARANAGALEEIDGAGLDQSGTYTAQHMLAGPVLEDHVFDAVIVQ